MKPLSELASAVHASATLTIDTMAKSMRAQGLDVMGFGCGEPDFPTPDNIKEAAIAAMKAEKTKYTPASGIPELKKAVCARMKADCGIDYQPSEVLIASGAKHNVYLIMRALLNPGDEVVLPAPFWVSYGEIVSMCGGRPVSVRTTMEEGFKITPESLDAAITDKTKCVIFNNPSNPTGAMYSGEELKALAEVCVRRDIYIVSDEIYYKLVYDGNEFVSFGTLGDEVRQRLIIINGVSKSYSMTGWRVGYSLAPENITKIMSNFVSHSTGAPSSISQWAAVEALNGPQEHIAEMAEEFCKRRDYIVSRINAIPFVSCRMPQGAFYVMMDISKVIGKKVDGEEIDSCDTFAAKFLEKGLVAVVPGSGFDAPGYIRWSYATSMDTIRTGMDRLEVFISQLND